VEFGALVPFYIPQQKRGLCPCILPLYFFIRHKNQHRAVMMQPSPQHTTKKKCTSQHSKTMSGSFEKSKLYNLLVFTVQAKAIT